MGKAILGRKVGMVQLYNEDGTVVPVTVIEAGPCNVLQLRTLDRDGYEAVQIGFDDRPIHKGLDGKPQRTAKRSERGHVARLESKRAKSLKAAGVEPLPKADCEPKRFIREIRGGIEDYQVGQELKVGVLEGVTAVDITGTSKGRGYAGVMKRHNFSGQRATHGVKKVHRHSGGTGCSANPSRTIKGTRMAGQYGNARITTRNLKVVKIDAENNLLVVRGAVPGPNGGYLMIRETNKLPQRQLPDKPEGKK